MTAACPSDETLALLNEGRLSDEQRREVMAHVEGCDGCRRAVAAVARLSAGKADPQIPPRYRVLRELGRGAVGTVLLAEDTVLGRKVALKLIRDTSSEAGALLLRESRAIARLSHRNVITLHDVVVEEGWGFISMEYLEGGSLAEWLEREHSFREVLEVFQQAARGLAAAHRAGVVHRDFKPANVLLGPDGRVCVSDFGLARLSDDPLLSTLTTTGGIVGTPAYMAPEQFDGGPLTAATDQFAFFVALHEALGRSRPFEGASIESVRQAVREGRRRAPARPIPAAVLTSIDRGLQTVPETRFPSMDVVADELARALAPSRRTRLLVGALATLVLGGLVALGVSRGGATCPPLTGRASAWTAAQRRAVEKALASDAETMTTVVQALDATAGALDDAWAASCVDDRPVAQRAREQLCLADVLVQLEVAAQTLAAVPPESAPRALPVVRTLPEPKTCAKLEALSEQRPPPSNEPERTLSREGRGSMLEAEALRRLSRYSEAVDRVHRAKEKGERAHDRWLVADALRLEGRLQNNIGDYARAEKVLNEAIAAARETGDDVLIGRTAFSLAFVECLNQFHIEHCDAAARVLEEAAARRPVDELRASAAELRSARAAYRFDVPTTIAELKVALEAWQRVPQSMEDQLRSRFALAVALQGDFRPNDALAEYTALHAGAVDYWGPNHARVLQLEVFAPRLLVAQGRLSEAEAMLAKTRERVSTILGPTAAEFADLMADEAYVLELRGRPFEAFEVLRRAQELRPEYSFKFAASGLWARLGKVDELAALRKAIEADVDWKHRALTMDDIGSLVSLFDVYSHDAKTVAELVARTQPLRDGEPVAANTVVLCIPAIEDSLRRRDWKAAGAFLTRAKMAMQGRTDESISAALESFQARLALVTGDAGSAATVARAIIARAEIQGRRDATTGIAHLILGLALKGSNLADACSHFRLAQTLLEPYVLDERNEAKAAAASCR